MSVTDSVVDTPNTFRYPLADSLRFGLYPTKFPNLTTDSLRSAVSIKFSRVFKSFLNASPCPMNAIRSNRAINSLDSV